MTVQSHNVHGAGLAYRFDGPAKAGFDVQPMTGDDFARFVRAEIAVNTSRPGRQHRDAMTMTPPLQRFWISAAAPFVADGRTRYAGVPLLPSPRPARDAFSFV